VKFGTFIGGEIAVRETGKNWNFAHKFALIGESFARFFTKFLAFVRIYR